MDNSYTDAIVIRAVLTLIVLMVAMINYLEA